MPETQFARFRVRSANKLVTLLAAGVLLPATSVPCLAQKTVRVHTFNLDPSRSWNVYRNGGAVATVNSSAAGTVQFVTVAQAGDALRIQPAGGAAVPPVAPGGVIAVGDSVGCARISWNANAETDVIGYRVYYATAGGAAASPMDSVFVADTTATVCGLADGTWYLAVRAWNAAGLASVPSLEVSASVSNGNAQPPSPPAFVNASSGSQGCIAVSWLALGDPTVTGYEVQWGAASVANGSATAYDGAVDAGASNTAQVCGLGPGTWYVAVRSRNYAGMYSAFSPEQTITLVATAVAVSRFDATPLASGVQLEWEVQADGAIDGYRLLRRPAAGGGEIAVGPTLLPAVDTRFVDRTGAPDTEYEYTLVVVEAGGAETRSAPTRVRTRPLALDLEQNVPNPFNPTTVISFVLTGPGPVRLSVYDLRGAPVTTLLDETRGPGRHSISWNGRTRDGLRAASGAYFYRLTTNAGVRTRKMILLK